MDRLWRTTKVASLLDLVVACGMLYFLGQAFAAWNQTSEFLASLAAPDSNTGAALPSLVNAPEAAGIAFSDRRPHQLVTFVLARTYFGALS